MCWSQIVHDDGISFQYELKTKIKYNGDDGSCCIIASMFYSFNDYIEVMLFHMRAIYMEEGGN